MEFHFKGKRKISKKTLRSFQDGSIWNKWLAHFKDENVAVLSLLRLLNYKAKKSTTAKLIKQFYLVKEKILYTIETQYSALEYYYPEALGNRACPLCEARGCSACDEGKLYDRILYNKVFKLGDSRFSFHSFLRPVDTLKLREKPSTPLIIPIEADHIAVPSFFDGLELLKYWVKRAGNRNPSLPTSYNNHVRLTLKNNRFDLMMIPSTNDYEFGKGERDRYKAL